MKALPLHDGSQIPALGLGTWLSEPDEVYRAVRRAIEIGYRHIDCAWIYGNEEEVGRGIREALTAGDCTRDQLWITTKLWNDCHEPKHVQPALERSLKLLGLEYVDLYLVHWPVALKHGVSLPQSPDDFLTLDEVPLQSTWEAMAKLPATGLSRRVGVSNFSASKIEAVCQTGVVPVVNQVELHPYNQQNDLLAAMAKREILATAYSPLGSGGRPSAMRGEAEVSLLGDPAVNRIADSHNATPAQVLLAWGLARGTSVIPKSTNPARIAQNLAAREVELTAKDRAALDGLEKGARYVSGSFWCPEGSPYTLESLWG